MRSDREKEQEPKPRHASLEQETRVVTDARKGRRARETHGPIMPAPVSIAPAPIDDDPYADVPCTD